MSFEDVMGALNRWTTATEALAAVAAELTLKQSGQSAPPEIVSALRGISEAAGLGDLDELTPQQQMMAAAIARMYVRHAIDLLDDPARAPGWAYTDPVILDGWGRGSMQVPSMIANAHDDLRDVERFLDVGTGVGLLAIAAAGVWPNAQVVGVDVWDTSLERARTNVAQAGLDQRVTLRKQNVVDVDDADAFDCIWVPTFFLSEEALTGSLAALRDATRPGGWIVLGRFSPPPDPLAVAVGRLRTIRGGGSEVDTKRAIELLEGAGYTSVHTVAPAMPAPLELVLGQRRA